MGELLAGRYELIEPIGEGGSGTVWIAMDHRGPRLVAAKVMRQSDAVSLQRFAREQSHRIPHDRVLAPIGWAADDDRVVLATPLKRGGSVRTLLSDYGALPVRWATEIAHQTAQALEAVHAAGVVHRDLKPENLLLDATGAERPAVFLADFGTAVTNDAPRLTVDGTAIGTPGYLAPEVLAGHPPSPVQDLYALGALIEELTGHEADGSAADSGASELLTIATGLMAVEPRDRPSATEAAGMLGALTAQHWEVGSDDIEVLEQISLDGIQLQTRAAPLRDADRDPTARLAPEGPTRPVAPRPSGVPLPAVPRQPEPEPARPLADPPPVPSGRWQIRNDPAVLAMAAGGIVLLLIAVLLLVL